LSAVLFDRSIPFRQFFLAAVVHVGLSDHHSGLPHGIDTLWGNTGFDGYLFDFDFAEDLFGVNLVTGLLGGPHGSEMATPLVPANSFPFGYSIQTARGPAEGQKTRVSTGLYAGLF